jgi:hypothetical protein
VKLSVYPAITLEALNKHLSEKPLVTVTNKQIGYCEITADSTLVPHEMATYKKEVVDAEIACILQKLESIFASKRKNYDIAWCLSLSSSPNQKDLKALCQTLHSQLQKPTDH